MACCSTFKKSRASVLHAASSILSAAHTCAQPRRRCTGQEKRCGYCQFCFVPRESGCSKHAFRRSITVRGSLCRRCLQKRRVRIKTEEKQRACLQKDRRVRTKQRVQNMSAHDFRTWQTAGEDNKASAQSNKRAVDSDKGPYAPPRPPAQEQPLMYLPGADDPFDPEECKARALGLMAHFRGTPLEKPMRLDEIRAKLGQKPPSEDYMDMEFDVGAPAPAPAQADDEASRRQRGLETPLDASNKGFEMLRKMGYDGGGLGRDGAGIEKPLATEARRPRDTQGVGIPQAARRAQLSWEAARRHVEQRERADFAQHNQRRFSDRACLKAARRARSACRDLDERQGLRWTPIWPSDEAHPQRSFADASGAVYAQPGTYLETGQNDGIGGLDEEAPEVALRTAVAYLRDCHGYCLVHGCTLDDGSPDLEAELAELVDDAED